MHKRLVVLPGRQAAEHRRGGGREVVSISRVEGRTGDAARVPGVATSREVRAREPQPRTLQRGLAPPPAAVDGGVDGLRRACCPEQDGVHGEAPLKGAGQLELGATYAEAGVGASLWDASIALSLFQRSGELTLPASARVVELGAGLGLPGLDLARKDGVASVTLTDARSKLLSLALQNIDALRQNHLSVTAKLDVAPLQWGDAPGDNDLSALGGVDVAIGSDICYEEACVGPLAALLERLAAPLTLLIGPVGRSSYALLRQRLKASSMLRTEERLLSLVCNNADDHQPATVHSAGVHSLLIVRRDDGAASSA